MEMRLPLQKLKIHDLKEKHIGQSGRTVLLLTGSAVFANLIPLVALPILTRLYEPAYFGMLATYTATLLFLLPLSSLEYGHALVYAKTKSDIDNLLSLSVLINVIFTVIITGLLLLVSAPLARFFKMDELSPWFYSLPATFLFFGLTQTLSYWANRRSLFKHLGISKIIRALATSILSIVLGMTVSFREGLVVGFMVGYVVSFFYLAMALWKRESFTKTKISIQSMRGSTITYRNFALYTLPSGWLSAVSTEFPVYFITHYFGLTTAGYFERTRQVLNAPLTQIGTSFAEVFKNAALKLTLEGKSCESLFVRTFQVILIPGIIIFFVILFFAPWLFAFVLGSGWSIAGNYAQFLIVMFSLKLVSMPITNMYYIMNKHKESLLMGIVQLASLLTFMSLAYWLSQDVRIVLLSYALVYGLFYLIGIYRSYVFSKQTGVFE